MTKYFNFIDAILYQGNYLWQTTLMPQYKAVQTKCNVVPTPIKCIQESNIMAIIFFSVFASAVIARDEYVSKLHNNGHQYSMWD